MNQDHLDMHEILDRRSAGNRRRVLELAEEFNNLAIRVHQLEDHFELDGIVRQLQENVEQLALAIRQLIDVGQQYNSIGTEIGSNERTAPANDTVRT